MVFFSPLITRVKSRIKVLFIALLVVSFSSFGIYEFYQTIRENNSYTALAYDTLDFGKVNKYSAHGLIEPLVTTQLNTLVEISVGQVFIENYSLYDLGLEYDSLKLDKHLKESFIGDKQMFLLPSEVTSFNTERFKLWQKDLSEQIEKSFGKPAIHSSFNGETLLWAVSGLETKPKIFDVNIESFKNYLLTQLDLQSRNKKQWLSLDVLAFLPEDQLKTNNTVYKKAQQTVDSLNTIFSLPWQIQAKGSLEEKEITVSAEDYKSLVLIQDYQLKLVDRPFLEQWVDIFISSQVEREASKVSIVGVNDSTGHFPKAEVTGEFLEGIKIDKNQVIEDIMKQLQRALDEKQALQPLLIKTLERPVKILDTRDGYKELTLLGVGYSNYALGNADYRVHNIETGINRINMALLNKNSQISFNKTLGSINNQFRYGYGIFGANAQLTLGGGVCQVSTTFYRALLNAGLPIEKRQNHSWDLPYYRDGGYGLDATIFPSLGLDVLSKNNTPGDIFVYAYTRPQSNEAFVLFYGEDDGRKTELKPVKVPKPYSGSKTIIWERHIQYRGGQEELETITSRYRR